MAMLLGGCATTLRPGADEAGFDEILQSDHSGDEVSAVEELPQSDDQAESPVVAASHVEPTDFSGMESLQIDEVLQHALSRHPSLRAREHEVQIARAKLTTAGLLPNPQLVMDSESPVHESDPTDLTTRVTFTIPTGGKRRLGRAVACAGIRRAQLALGRETEAVLVEAADAAMEVLYLQELLALQGQLSELAAKEAEVQNARFKVMAGTFADKIEADFDAADIELERLEVAGQLKVARLRLARAMGLTSAELPQMAGAHVVVPIPDVPLDTILAAARTTRPELAEARAAVTESQREAALAYAQAKPDLEIGPRYQAALGEEGDQIGARLNLDLPLFNRNQGGISASHAQLRVNRAMLDVTELNSLNDVASAYLQLLSVRSRLQYYDQHVMPLIDRTEASVLRDLQQPGIDANQLSDLLQDFVKMRVSQLNLRYRYNQLLIRLELLLGCRLGDLVAQPATMVTEISSPIPEMPIPDMAVE